MNYYINLFLLRGVNYTAEVFAYANISAKSKPYAKILDLVSKCMAHMGKNQEGKIYGQKSCDTLPLNTFLCQFSVQFNWQVLIFNQSKSPHNINSLNLKVENV